MAIGAPWTRGSPRRSSPTSRTLRRQSPATCGRRGSVGEQRRDAVRVEAGVQVAEARDGVAQDALRELLGARQVRDVLVLAPADPDVERDVAAHLGIQLLRGGPARLGALEGVLVQLGLREPDAGAVDVERHPFPPEKSFHPQRPRQKPRRGCSAPVFGIGRTRRGLEVRTPRKEYAPYLTTKLTSFSGTTTSLTTVRPSRCVRTFGDERTRSRTAWSSSPRGSSSRSRSLPL